MNKLIAICGLDCEKCDARKATLADDNDLREKTAKLWSELNSFEISAEMINCVGCRTEGVKTVYCSSMCAIRQCALHKKFDTCAECPKIDNCETLSTVTCNCTEAFENLKKK